MKVLIPVNQIVSIEDNNKGAYTVLCLDTNEIGLLAQTKAHQTVFFPWTNIQSILFLENDE